MVNDGTLDQAQLQGLVRAQAAFELVAEPVKTGEETRWVMDVVLANGERLWLCKTRQKDQRKAWKQLSALHRFIENTVPEVDRITLLTAPRSERGS